MLQQNSTSVIKCAMCMSGDSEESGVPEVVSSTDPMVGVFFVSFIPVIIFGNTHILICSCSIIV